jgi:hypothetical protein
MIDRLMPMIGRFFFESESIVCSTQPRMKPTNLVVAVWPVFELIDRLAVVIPCEFEMGKFAVNVPTDFERRGKHIDAIKVGIEGLLGLLDGCVCRVERFAEISSSSKRFNTVPKDSKKSGGGRVHCD